MIKAKASGNSLKTGAEAEWLESQSAEVRVEWALARWGSGLVLSTSFGVQSAVMLHMATRIRSEIPVIFVDTGYLFPETYQFAEQLVERFSLNLKINGEAC